jgi:hypothetical protein
VSARLDDDYGLRPRRRVRRRHELAGILDRLDIKNDGAGCAVGGATGLFYRSGLRIAPLTMPSADFSAAVTGLTVRSVRSPGRDGDLPR